MFEVYFLSHGKITAYGSLRMNRMPFTLIINSVAIYTAHVMYNISTYFLLIYISACGNYL